MKDTYIEELERENDSVDGTIDEGAFSGAMTGIYGLPARKHFPEG